jgi:hypothetical protein
MKSSKIKTEPFMGKTILNKTQQNISFNSLCRIYQRGNWKPYLEEGQTIPWAKGIRINRQTMADKILCKAKTKDQAKQSTIKKNKQ